MKREVTVLSNLGTLRTLLALNPLVEPRRKRPEVGKVMGLTLQAVDLGYTPKLLETLTLNVLCLTRTILP